MLSEIPTLTRAQARKANQKYYFTGKPCKNGHIARRYTNSGNCVECNKATTKRHAQRNRKKLAKWQREYRKNNPEYAQRAKEQSRIRNKERYHTDTEYRDRCNGKQE